VNYNLKDIFGKDFSSITNISSDDILEKMGLQKVPSTTSYVLPALGLFSVGMIVGASLGMLFAPKSGHDLRENIGSKANELAKKVGVTGRGNRDEIGTDFEVGRGSYAGGYEQTRSTYEGTGIGSSGVIGSSFEGKGTYPGAGEGGV
jgi:hypothetical protein